MRLETTLSQRMNMEMRLAPRMIQSMEILQMPIMDLQERIQQELDENPVLELKEGSDDGSLRRIRTGWSPRATSATPVLANWSSTTAAATNWISIGSTR